MREDTCIILTGLLNIDIDEFISTWKYYKKNVIISTWKDQDSVKLEKLHAENFICIESEHSYYHYLIPDYINTEPYGAMQITGTSNHQTHTFLEGYNKGVELGFTYFIRCRTDLVPSSVEDFVNSFFEVMNNYKLVFLSHARFSCGRRAPQDFIIFGSKTEIIKLFKYITPENIEYYKDLFYELALQYNYFGEKNIVFQDAGFPEVYYKLKEKQCTIKWISYGYRYGIKYIFQK